MKQKRDPQPQWPAHLSGAERARDPLAVFLESPAIKEIRRDVSPLSEREYCERLVAFANEGRLPTDTWFEFLGGAHSTDDRAVTRRAPSGQITEGTTKLVRDQLAQLVLHRETAGKVLGPWWAERAGLEGLVSLPVCVFDEQGQLTLEHRIIARNVLAALAYAMCLLLDNRRPHASTLWRCRLESCRRFFFEQRREGAGRPRREYCSEEHLEEAHRQQVLERVRRHRAKQKPGRKPK